jgi:hypothetical protein
MKTAIAAALLVVLAVSGCSSAEPADNARVAAGSTATEPPAPSETAAPVTIEPTAAPIGQWNGFATQDEWYLAGLKDALSGPASDDELLAAGKLACEQIAAGTPIEDVRVVTAEGAAADQDNKNIVTDANRVYCP